MQEKKVNYWRVGLAVAAILIIAAYFWGPAMVQKRNMDKGEAWLSENKETFTNILKGTEIKVEVTTRQNILVMGEVQSEEQKKAILDKLNKLNPPIPFRIKIYRKKRK